MVDAATEAAQLEQQTQAAFVELNRLSLAEPSDDASTPALASAFTATADRPMATRKENINLVFVGHVDAGKSTLGGHILYLTGQVDQRTLEKYEKESKEMGRESWFWSWALDTNAEERAKGITVECGRATFELDKRRFTILDAPGHKNYVPSMISGAAQADVAVLVVSARRGEFETGFERGGQTREHATLVRTLGVKRLVVAINKMDDPTVEWSRDRYDEIVNTLTPFLKQTGFNVANEVDFLPLSGFTGANIKESSGNLTPWYTGQPFFTLLDTMPAIERATSGPLRIPIADKYRDLGTVIAGKIESGRVVKGQSVLLMPDRRSVELLAIFLEELEVNEASAGDNVRLRLRGVDEDEVMPGYVICEAARPVRVARAFTAQIIVLQIKNIISLGYEAVMHVHTATEPVTISAFISLIDKKTGQKTGVKPRFVKQGQAVVVKFETAEPLCLEAASECDALARFTIRDEGRTIAVGKVLQVHENGDVEENGIA